MQHHRPVPDEVDLHTDATVGVVETIGTDHIHGNVRRWAHGWLGAQSAMSSGFVGVIVGEVNNGHGRPA